MSPPTNLPSFEFDIATLTFQEDVTEETFQLEPFDYQVGTIEIVESRPPERISGISYEKQTKIRVHEQSQQGRQFIELLDNSTQLEMVEIPAGQFVMGVPMFEEGSSNSEQPQHEISIERFFLGTYPVTQAQYKAVMGNNPSNFHESLDSPNPPVELVSWLDAVEFCHRLSKQTGKEYRLPSEAEWEYACRAGMATPFHFGEILDAKVANYGQSNENQKKTTPVGSFKVANAFGLYDMHGNVWEWCADNWHSNYEIVPDSKDWIEGGDREKHPIRGGSWDSYSLLCRSACRNELNPNYGYNYVGFRVACSARELL